MKILKKNKKLDEKDILGHLFSKEWNENQSQQKSKQEDELMETGTFEMSKF